MGQGYSLRTPWKHSDTRIKSEENGIDPDDGNSWKCSGCTLPIFSTPFTIKHGHFLHDQCANLPDQLMDHVVHRGQPLTLKEKWDPLIRGKPCDKCLKECGSMMYRCRKPSCGLRLDLLCSIQIKILHRSHAHRLMAIRGSASFICGACGTQHQGLLSSPSYLCIVCDFWIHNDCASSPNAIRLVVQPKHEHSLFLTYHFAAVSSTRSCKCAICGENLLSWGAYLCVKCGFYVHIRCATSDPQNFEPVLIRDAKLADLLHLPMADEGSSIVQYMLENTSVRAGDDHDEASDACDEHHHDDDEEEDDDDEEEEAKEEEDGRLHKHPLIFHDEEEDDVDSDDDDGTGHSSSRVCNACVQFISSPPYYSCSQCPDFLLHSSCANLPSKIRHPFHKKHALFLSTKPSKSYHDVGFRCRGCNLVCNGFEYRCRRCRKFSMDVLCALMPPSITHASHGKTHILYMSPRSRDKCSCCNLNLNGLFYECTHCRHLKLHADCALLPMTISHSFDVHPLKLTVSSNIPLLTTNDVDHDDDDIDVDVDVDGDGKGTRQQICELCEKDVDEMLWHYSCSDCQQAFHADCIPFLGTLSRIKFGVTICVTFHDCPLTLVRDEELWGHFCNHCGHNFRDEDDDDSSDEKCAFECSKCCYRIHDLCAKLKMRR